MISVVFDKKCTHARILADPHQRMRAHEPGCGLSNRRILYELNQVELVSISLFPERDREMRIRSDLSIPRYLEMEGSDEDLFYQSSDKRIFRGVDPAINDDVGSLY